MQLKQLCSNRDKGAMSIRSSSKKYSTEEKIFLTSKSFLNINHLPRARLHEPTAPTPRILQPLPTADHPAILQITLIPRHQLDRLDAAGILPVILLHIYHLHEVVEAFEGRGSRDVVDEEEGVRFEIRGGPQAPVFFLAGCVCEGEEVGTAVYGAGGGVGVLWEEGSARGKCRGRRWWRCGQPIVGSYLWRRRSAVCNVWGAERLKGLCTRESIGFGPAVAL